MENTIDNKRKFFALYWGQVVALVTKGSYTHPKDTMHVVCGQVINGLTPYVKHNYSLELKPLSSITDEDAHVIGNIFGWLESEGDTTCDILKSGHNIVESIATGNYRTSNLSVKLYMESVDFLRSKGYALSWMGLSIEKLQEYGWIKLKTD